MTEPSVLHLLFMAVLQGITELFPISSLGHSVLVPGLLHWHLDRGAPWFLPFIVVLHLGTATALLLYFWRDWAQLFSAFFKARGRWTDPQARLLWQLALGTVPAGLLGLAFEHAIRHFFTAYALVAVMLMVNGLILLVGDRLRRRAPAHDLESLGWGWAFGIGVAQSLALIPGLSRSGATLVAGLAAGLDYASAARFSFLLATPIIAAAGVLEVPKLLHHAAALHGIVHWIILSGLLAGAFAWLSTWFLMRWFKGHEFNALGPFAVYCLAFGALALVLG